MKDYPVLVEVDSMLLLLWKFLKFSPKRSEIQQAYGLPSLKLIRAAATTRWLSHGDACVRLIKRYEQVLNLLDEVYDEKRCPEAFGIRSCLLNKNNSFMVLFLADMLRPLMQLSLYLQGSAVNFSHLDVHVKIAVNELHALIEKLQDYEAFPELHFSKVDSILQEINDRTVFARRLRDNGNLAETPKFFLQRKGVPLIYSFIQEVETAFQVTPLLASFGVLDPQNIPSAEELLDYGKDDIQRLAKHYGTQKADTFQGHLMQVDADIDQQATRCEFQGFRHHLYMISWRNRINFCSFMFCYISH